MTEQTIHLQSIGRCHAKPAGDLRVGDRTVWNFGYVERVESVEPKGKQSVLVTLVGERGGYRGQRTMRRDRLVGITA